MEDEFFEDSSPQMNSHILIRDKTTGEILVNKRGEQIIQKSIDEDDE